MDPEDDASLVVIAQRRCSYYGMMPAEFFEATPIETSIWHKAMAEHEHDVAKSDWQRTVFETWHVAAFGRSKKMPPYEKLLNMIGIETSKAQTPMDMMKVAEQLTIALGGKPIEKKAAK